MGAIVERRDEDGRTYYLVALDGYAPCGGMYETRDEALAALEYLTLRRQGYSIAEAESLMGSDWD